MAKGKNYSQFLVGRDDGRCVKCQACVRVCSNEVHSYDGKTDSIRSDSSKCVGCHFCEEICPTEAISIERNKSQLRKNANWTQDAVYNIVRQAKSGGMLLTGMGSDKNFKNYFDRIVLNASQVTNPSMDPLREPMELKTFIGSKPERVAVDRPGKLMKQLEIATPIMFSAMSFGSISLNACKSLAKAAADFGTFWNTGEGGLHRDLERYSSNAIVQVASGRFGVNSEYLEKAAAVEIKIGQGAKPGIGGHLPGEKVSAEISRTRMIPEGTDAISPAPHHDIYSIEDLKQLVFALKEATLYKKPVGVKISAVNNVAPIASGIVRAGADFVVIDGIRGGTGAAPLVTRDNVGIPIELAVAVVDERLRQEGIRHKASVIAAGGFRSSADVIKAVALGADAVYIGTAALVSLGCHLCQKCYTGKCNWGIATQDEALTKRLNPETGARQAYNLLRAWSMEIKELLGGMGINAIESLRGNRDNLRGIDLDENELKILGIKHAGQ